MQRTGLNETVPMGSAMPVSEYQKIWTVGGEVIIPLGPVVLAGAGNIGDGTGYYGGMNFQRTRIDTTTGKHRMLRSWGAWAQISVPLRVAELSLVGGAERVLKGLDFGPDARGASDDIRSNYLGAAVLTYELTKKLRIGQQLQYVRTEYTTDTMSNWIAVTFAYFRL
jgi:hypothetical protein